MKLSGIVWLSIISVSYSTAMLTSNEALKYVSYPFQALAKSCKMVPVMLANVLIGVKYQWHQYFAVFLITVGILIFQFKSSSSPPPPHHHHPGGGGAGQQQQQSHHDDSSLSGFVLLFASLALDGVTGSNQYLFDKEFALSTHELMFGMNLFSSLFIFICMLLTNELERGIVYVSNHPWIIQDILLFGLCSAMGQNFIFYTITGVRTNQ